MQSTIPFLTFELKMDALSAFFVLALSILVLCVSIYSIDYLSHYIGKRPLGLFHFLYALFILSMMFVLTSSNALFFYIAWEVMALVSYFLVIFESEKEENRKAGALYVVMTHLATAFLLGGFMIVYRYTGSFDLFGSAEAVPELVKNIVFLFFVIGFGTKAGMIPLHIWLPYAHPAAPSNVSALMSGIMIKTAVYGLARFVIGFLGIEQTWWGVLILSLGIISAVLGVAYALMEQNIKRLLAFSSVENMGIILIGMGAAMIALSKGNSFVAELALTACLFHTLNHSLFKGGLFLGAGSIQYACHTKEIEDLGGLIKKMPITAALFLCFSLAVSSIVPFNGFVSEWLTLQSLFASIVGGQEGLNILSILGIAALGMAGAFAVACFVKLFGIAFLGLPRSEHAENAKEVPVFMNLGIGILAGACLLIGLFPLAMLKLVDKAAFSLTGASIFEELHGGLLIASCSIEWSKGAVSPIVFVLLLGIIVLLLLVTLRLIGGKYKEKKYGTWDCGYAGLNSRMQYTGTGFSKPLKIVFKILYRPSRKLELRGESAYHPEKMEYITSSESIFEKYIYRPIFTKARSLSRFTKLRIQTGSIHNYLLYIFIAVLVLMTYHRFA
ncbi:MAG: proton-conducting transporter membrane subunit [Eubacteriales bacterium]|nr:proton-conducting transporter membrane subunit [Eubacteriales bacterium]